MTYEWYRAAWIKLCILTVGVGVFLWAYSHGEAKAEPGVVPFVIVLTVLGHAWLLRLMYATRRAEAADKEEENAGDEEIGPEYQIVLEFAGDDAATFARVVALQEKLARGLQAGEVDGNDTGQGITNIFLNTYDPAACFAEAMQLIARSELQPRAAGFRDLTADDYIRLLPKNDPTPFELK